MKVVINSCHGGFGLSGEAFEKLLERKGIAFDKVEVGRNAFGASYYKAGQPHTDENYISEYDLLEDRADEDLIAVVEEMGTAAEGRFSELKVIEIPDDVEWCVEEYDGLEWIAEVHRTWS
jgi:hypothetical protein